MAEGDLAAERYEQALAGLQGLWQPSERQPNNPW